MFNFNSRLEAIFNSIVQYANECGVQVYFVGGMVRDCLMGIETKDIDILIEGSAIDFVQNFILKNNNKFNIFVKSTHEAFNTVKTVINAIEIDFASTREENYPKSGCLPIIQNVGCTIKKDLKRRDFTINSIAAKLYFEDGKLNYEIIDPFDGMASINKKTLEVLHKNSYIDDPTRILRGIDFSFRFDFDFSFKDKNLIQEYLEMPDREGLSLNRIKLTLKKLFSHDKSKEAYEYILENKIYKIWCDIPIFKLEWVNRLYDSAEIFNLPVEDIFLKVLFESPCIQNIDVKKVSNFEIFNFYKTFKPLELALLYSIFDDKNAVFYYKKLKDIKLGITGDDLIKQGFKQGKELGEELNRQLKQKINSIKRD